MASGSIPYTNDWLKIVKFETYQTTSDVLHFAGNNERHLVLILGPSAAQNFMFVAKTNSAGVSSKVDFAGTGEPYTFTTGTRTLTIAHTSASLMYIDFAFSGTPLTL